MFIVYFGVVVARVTQIKNHAWDHTAVVLVGNKCDMEEFREVPWKKAQALADELGMARVWTKKPHVTISMLCRSYANKSACCLDDC